jgi:hypothetical protein
VLQPRVFAAALFTTNTVAPAPLAAVCTGVSAAQRTSYCSYCTCAAVAGMGAGCPGVHYTRAAIGMADLLRIHHDVQLERPARVAYPGPGQGPRVVFCEVWSSAMGW